MQKNKRTKIEALLKMFGKQKNNITSKPCKPYGVDVGNYFDDYFEEKKADWKERFAEENKSLKSGRQRK
jgi:hypothetical protein